MACPLRSRRARRSRVGHDPQARTIRLFGRTGWNEPATNRKALVMNHQPNPTKPLYRVTFSRITGHDPNGAEMLTRPKEIGAVWPRKNGKAGGVLQLDIIPVELTQRKGVMFITPLNEGGAQ